MSLDENTAIQVSHVSKTFKLPHEKTTSIKSAVVNFYKRKKSFDEQNVLKDVSFEVKKGEFFGIVGRNGSGKSTLLKILAGIYIPTRGSVQINGKLTPFIELGVGFNMDLSGRENTFLNGALLGFSRTEMQAMYEDIVSFAELEGFMDQKLKNYSSGMQVRLAFSIAIRAKSEVLLIDEVLAVGDASFQQKCYEVFADLKKRGTTIILVTHDMSAVLRFCDRAVHLNKGRVEQIGQPKEVSDSYLQVNFEEKRPSGTADEDLHEKKELAATIERVKLSNSKLKPGDQMRVDIDFKSKKNTPIHFGFQIFNASGVYCFGTNTNVANKKPLTAETGSIAFSFDADLVPGTYNITVATMNENATQIIEYKTNAASFRVENSTQIEGVALLKNKWEL